MRQQILFSKLFPAFFCISLLSLSGCLVGQEAPKDKEPVTIRKNTSGTSAEINKILVVNNGEVFSVVKGLKTHNPEMENNISMHLKEKGTFCTAPNDIQEHDGHLYLTCSTSQNIHVFNKETRALERALYLGNNMNPMVTAFFNERKAYSTAYNENQVLIFDPSPVVSGGPDVLGSINLKNLPLERIPGANGLSKPGGMALIGTTLYVALGNLTKDWKAAGPGYVAVIDTVTDQVTSLIKLSGQNTVSIYHSDLPEYADKIFAISAGDLANGAYLGNGMIDIIDINSNSVVTQIPLQGAPYKMAMGKGDDIAYVTNGKEGKILRFRPSTKEVLPPLDIIANECNDRRPAGFSYISSILLDPNYIFVTEYNSNCFIAIDRKTEKVKYEVKTGQGPQAMLVLE